MKQKNWFKPKPYTHLTRKLSLTDAGFIQNYVAEPKKIAKHRFYPLIHRTKVVKRFKTVAKKTDGTPIKKHYEIKGGKRISTAKYRELFYANHLDAHIYSYYTQKVLEPLYEAELKKDAALNESVIAYRRIEVDDKTHCKCNIDFANDIFEEIKKTKGEVAVLALDISKFFDSLDHKILKQVWKKLLSRKDLPDDHYNLFKSLTEFAYVEMKDMLNEFGYKHANLLIQKEVPAFINDGEEFRERIKQKGYLKKNPFRRIEKDGTKTPIGIPQGTPISAFLANLYLLEFDKEVLQLTKSLNTIYRRYSDDIFIICPKQYYEQLEKSIYSIIDKYKLIIQPIKTQRTFFNNAKLFKGEKPITYLGFQFDGHRKLLKPSSLSKYFRKLKANVSYRAYRAKEAKKKKARGIDVDITLYRKKLYQQFSHLTTSKGNRKKRNFFAYAHRAAKVMDSPHINNQLSKSWGILHSEIERYEKRYNLPKIK